MTRFCRVIRKRKLIPLLLVTSLVVGWWAHKFSVYYSGHIVAQSIAPGNGQAAIAIDRPSFLPIGHRRIIRVYSIVSGTEKKQVYEYSARESLDGRIRFIWTKDGEYFLLVGRNLGVSDPRLKTSTDEDVLLL